MHAQLLGRVHLCDPVDCSPPGSSVHGISQARILEWVVIPFSRGSNSGIKPTSPTSHLLHWQTGSLPQMPLGKPIQCSLHTKKGDHLHLSTQDARDAGWIATLGKSPGEGNDNPLQYSCLENPMDVGAWCTTVQGVAKSQTQLCDL